MIINTTKGEMDDSQLVKVSGCVDEENSHAHWVEYWIIPDRTINCAHECKKCGAELVHRSAYVAMKKLPELFAQKGEVSG